MRSLLVKCQLGGQTTGSTKVQRGLNVPSSSNAPSRLSSQKREPSPNPNRALSIDSHVTELEVSTEFLADIWTKDFPASSLTYAMRVLDDGTVEVAPSFRPAARDSNSSSSNALPVGEDDDSSAPLAAPAPRKTRKRGRVSPSPADPSALALAPAAPRPISRTRSRAPALEPLPAPTTEEEGADPAPAPPTPRAGRLLGRRKAAPSVARPQPEMPAPAPEEARGTGEASSSSAPAPPPPAPTPSAAPRVSMKERARRRYSRYTHQPEDGEGEDSGAAAPTSPAPRPAPSSTSGFSVPLEELQGQVLVLAEIARKLGREGLKFFPHGPSSLLRSAEGDQPGAAAPRKAPAPAASRPLIDDSAVSMFLYDMGHVPVLEKAEEMALTRIMYQHQVVDRAFIAVDEANHAAVDALIPPARWPALLEAAACASAPEAMARRRVYREARALMVHYNLRLVISVANKYRNKGLDFEDLIPEGIQGLSRALDKFDPSRGFKFSTYAHWWIRQALTRAITEHSRVVRLPVHVSDAVSKSKRITAQLRTRLGRSPTTREVAHVMGLPVERLEVYLKAARPHRSLEQTIQADQKARNGGDNNTAAELNEMLMAEEDDPTLLFGMSDPDDVLRDQAIKEELNRVLEGLDKRERNILKLRYGMTTLTDHQAMTFTDIGNMHGLTKERIRQIEVKALTKLRRKETRADLESVLYDYKLRRPGIEEDDRI